MNWINDFVDLGDLDKEALIHRFTLSSAEVEDIYHFGADTQGVVVGKILSVENHPSSKKLHLLKVDAGKGEVDCVCGAPNVRVGMTVAFAPAGSTVSGHPITEAKVAGFDSCGMCCSEAELGISADNSGLWELDDSLVAGTDLKSLYDIDDIVFEVDNKSLTNRPDLWGHYGIAREFATLTGRPLREVPTVDLAAYNALPGVDISIDVPELCYRYCGLKLDNIKTKISPVNMRIRLFYCGMRAINLLADLTNYVMLELGQPMHAFDLRRVDNVVVKKFDEAFSFTTLDKIERKIDPETCMICTKKADGSVEPVAVAGIMGGYESEIEDDTDSLLLESASFSGVSVRKSSTRLGLRTDASMRYEKMLDPYLTNTATARFVKLLTEIDPDARVISSLTDVFPNPPERIVLTITREYVDRYTGIEISTDEITRTLTALGFDVVREGNTFTVTVPTHRATKDVTIPADLIEEITRIYGYDNFEAVTSRSALYPVRPSEQKTCDDRAKDLLVLTRGLHEVHSYIWCDAAKYRQLGIDLPENPRIINAQTPDHAVLRRSIIPTLLSFVSENKSFADSFGIFEIGHTVEGVCEDGTANERKKLGIVLWSKSQSEEALYMRLRDIVVSLCSDIRHALPIFSDATERTFGWTHPKNTTDITLCGKKIGFFAAPHPSLSTAMDKKAAFVFAEIDMDDFASIEQLPLAYNEPSRFPSIDIDLSFFADTQTIDFRALEKKFFELAGGILASVKVADIYVDADSNESVTFRFEFSSPERTLSKAELTPTTNALIEYLESVGLKFKAA